jgi:hypothetical protein
MNKFVRAALLSAVVSTAGFPKTSFAIPVLPPAPVISGGAGATAGAAVVGGFLALVAALDLYDIIRRTTCSGDFLHLGGPGFTSPITPGMTILPVMCVPAPTDRNRHRHPHQ